MTRRPTKTHSNPALLALAGLLALGLHASGAAAEPPPLPTGKDTGASSGSHRLFIDGIPECPDFEDAPLTYKVKWLEGRRFKSALGDARRLAGRVKLKDEPVDLGFELRYVARLKLDSASQRKVKKWLKSLVRQCTGDPKAKVNIKKLRYQISAETDSDSWFRIPTMDIEAVARSGGEKLGVTLYD
ncbi:MAG: hypothetical protein ACQGVK_05855 [Myxococcota bacterium]